MKTITLRILTAVLFSVFCFCRADSYPYHDFPATAALPTNSVIMQYVAPPSPFTLESVDFSPGPLASFLAQTNNADIRPPDTMGAVGPNHVISMLNSNVRIQNRTGTTISTVSLLAWWTNATFNVFDPRIIYDSISAR